MGNKTSALVTNGAHTFTEEERETNDYYATPPEAVEKLLSVETFKFVMLGTFGKKGLTEILLLSGFKQLF